VHVLLVEDDDAIAEPLIEGLSSHGFEVTWVRTGREAQDAMPVELVLLDLGLPGEDGMAVFRRLRERIPSLPVIMLTARGDEIDRVLGLEMGADDYVVKPFGLRELVARMRAVLRRRGDEPDSRPVQVIGDLEIDRLSRRVRVAGPQVDLTPKEFDLLAYLAADAGAVRPRGDIIDNVWDPHWWGPTKTLDVHVASLRRKLGDPRWIETVRNIGYRMLSET
jgi:two-component system response regulator RegX3